MDNGELFPSQTGAPQGGTLSPLLANIALHGMENLVKEYAVMLKLFYPSGSPLSKNRKRRSLHLIKYADDFVCIHEDLEVVQACKEIIADWLGKLGLSLKPSKTRIVHTLEAYQGSPRRKMEEGRAEVGSMFGRSLYTSQTFFVRSWTRLVSFPVGRKEDFF